MLKTCNMNEKYCLLHSLNHLSIEISEHFETTTKKSSHLKLHCQEIGPAEIFAIMNIGNYIKELFSCLPPRIENNWIIPHPSGAGMVLIKHSGRMLSFTEV